MRRTLHDRGDHFSWQTLQGSESALSGAGAGIVSAIITCPLDVVKTKLQAQVASIDRTAPKYKGLVGTLRKILQEEGLRGWYRGLGPTLFGYAPTWCIYFATYDSIKHYMTLKRNTHEEDLTTHVIAAMTAGACGTIATNPLWVIKTRFMTQNVVDGKEKRYRHTGDAIRRIYKNEGLYGFYRGMVPSLFGVTHVAVQFPLYEHFKKLNRPLDGGDVPPSVILACSSSSKMIASICTYPHEVLRTRLQIQQSSPSSVKLTTPFKSAGKITDLCRQIWNEGGIAGFYRGLTVNLIRTVPSSALTILTYELLMRQLIPRTQGQRYTS